MMKQAPANTKFARAYFYGTVLAPNMWFSLFQNIQKAFPKFSGMPINTSFIAYYSIIVATLPDPTVLPPSRNYLIIVWYILFDFSCFHCSFWLFVLPLFLFAKWNDDSLTTLSYYLFPIVNLGYHMYDTTMLYYQQAYAIFWL